MREILEELQGVFFREVRDSRVSLGGVRGGYFE